MKKFLLLPIMLTFFGCNISDSKPESPLNFHAQDNPSQTKAENENFTSDKKHRRLEIELSGMKLLATIDEVGGVTILNYPNSWEGKAKLIRFDGQALEKEAFSSNHCERIRNIASVPQSGSFVRSGFPSLISFELPAFLSSTFMNAVREKATTAGFNFSVLNLKNPPDTVNSYLELKLSNEAISNLLGNYRDLKEQLHLGQKGVENERLEKEVIIYSGDIICDLISGAAEITMTFPIRGEDRAIKVNYKPLKVLLDQSKKSSLNEESAA